MPKTDQYIIPWDDNLNTGIPWIDEQHKQLLKRIESMLNALINQECGDQIKSLIDFLVEYVHTHFNAEQSYMLRYNYPLYLAHDMQHKEFRNKLKKMKDNYALHGARRELAVGIAKELWEWYKNHICLFDKSFASFLKENHASDHLP
jgi:hemerythrin